MPSKAKRKAAKRPSRVVKGKPAATKPTLLSGGNPQIAKADGDAPVQAYIAAMPGWKRDLGKRLDALIVRNVPNVRKAVKWNSPFYGIEGQGWFLASTSSRATSRWLSSAARRCVRSRPASQAQGRALPRHPRRRRARRGADGDVGEAGRRVARLGSVASQRCAVLGHGHCGHALWHVELAFLSWVLRPVSSEPVGLSPESSQNIVPRSPRQLA